MKYIKTKYPNIFTYTNAKGKFYYVRKTIIVQGKKKEITKSGLKTLSQARSVLSDIEQKAKNNEYVIDKNLTVNTYWDMYCESRIKTGRWAPDTIYNKDKTYTNRFKERYGKLKMRDVSRHEYEMYINDLLKNYTYHSVKQAHGVFNAMFNDAVTNKYLDDNPIDGIYIGKSSKPSKNKRLSLDEFKAWDEMARSILSDYQYTMVRLTYLGLRRSEVAGLKFSDFIKRTDGLYTITITESRTEKRKDGKALKTQSSRRTLIADGKTSPLIDAAIKQSYQIGEQCDHILSKDDFLFRVAYDTYKRFGEPIRVGYLQTLFSKVNNQLGIKVSPHMMRHFFATQGVIAGVPIAHMAAALGHSTHYMTEKYTHIKDEVASNVTQTIMQAIN